MCRRAENTPLPTALSEVRGFGYGAGVGLGCPAETFVLPLSEAGTPTPRPTAGLDDHPHDLFDGGQPGEDLLDPVVAQDLHALLARDASDLLGGAALGGEPLDLLGLQHHLVGGHAPAIAGLRAVGAPDRPV